MNRLVSLGLLGLLSALAFSACSDDEDGGGPAAGAGGTAGGGGQAGTGGAAGGGAGGTGGTSGGTGGTGQEGAACPGCVRLDVPFTAENQSANYQFNFETPVDFSNTVVTARFRVNSFAGNAGGIQLYVQNGAPGYESYGFQFYRNISDFVDQGFQEITLDLTNVEPFIAADAGVPDAGGGVVTDAGAGDAGDAGPGLEPNNGFNKAAVSIVGFQVASGGTFMGAPFGAVQVDVDSITFAPAGVTPDRTFATEADATAFTGVGTPVGTKTYVAE